MSMEASSPISASSRSKPDIARYHEEGRVSSLLVSFLSPMRHVLLLSLMFLLSSCSLQNDAQVLDVAVSQEPPTFDVHVNSSQVARLVMTGNVFEQLVTLDGEGRPVPELCDSFESSDDCFSWTFHLRDDVLFHNGRTMTSEDVVLSLNRWLDYCSSARTMLGDARFWAPDETSVRIDADHPILLLPYMMAASPQSAVIYAREMLSSLDGDGLVTQYIGTGPYMVKEWMRGEYISLVRFDDYCAYGGEMDGLAGYKHAYIPRIVYHFVPDAFARTAGCESGRYLFMNDLMSDDVERLEKRDDLVVSRGDEAGSLVLLFNKREGLASNGYIRTAVNTAVDLDVVMAACYGDSGYVMHPDYMESSQVLWSVTDHDDRYDVGDKDAARRILEENGYDGTPLRILTSNLSNMDRSALALAQELEAAGFATELVVVDWATMMAYRSDPAKWDVCVTAMTMVPVPTLKLFLSPDYAGWSDDARLQGMMEDLSSCTSIGEAQDLWAEIQDYCYDYLPAIVCGHYQSGYLYSADLVGVDEFYGFHFYNSRILQ